MAREVIEKLVDDLDGGDANETVAFALDGASFEIDLSKKNATAFRKLFDRYVKAGRRSSPAGARRSSPAGGRRRSARASTNGSKPKREFDIAQLREWAGANDVTVPARGRIPQAVVEQYKQARGR
jgi:nucleoid-associated protein Lsr2